MRIRPPLSHSLLSVCLFFLCFWTLPPVRAQESALKLDKTGRPTMTLRLDSPNVQGSLDATHFTLGTTAGTIAAGDDPRFDIVTLEQYGDVTGDCGLLCQEAANDLGARGGGVIQLKAHAYNFATKVTLPPGVILAGSNDGPRQKTVANIAAPPLEAPTATGTTICLLYGPATSDTDQAGITLGKGATVRDTSFFEPNQHTSGTPIAYPFVIRMTDYGANVINVEFINNFRGIDVGSNTVYAGRFLIQNITGNPLSSGLRINGVGDFATIDGVHFADTWSRDYPDMDSFTQQNGVVLSVGRADNIQVNNVSSYQYHIGLDLFTGAGGFGAYGVFDKLSFDLSDICVNIRGNGSRQVQISHGIFLAKNYAVYQPNGGGNVLFTDCYSGAGNQNEQFPLWYISGYTEAFSCHFENNNLQNVATVHVYAPSATHLEGMSFDISPKALGNSGAAIQVDGINTNGYIPTYYIGYNRGLETPDLAAGSGVKTNNRAMGTGLYTVSSTLSSGDNFPIFSTNADQLNGGSVTQQGIIFPSSGPKNFQAAIYLTSGTPGSIVTLSVYSGTNTNRIKAFTQGVIAANGTLFLNGDCTFDVVAGDTTRLNINLSSGSATLTGGADISYVTMRDY